MSFGFGGKISLGPNLPGLSIPTLIDYYDISNNQCYVSGSSTATNIIKFTDTLDAYKDLTLFNNPSYDTSYRGSLITNGSTSYIELKSDVLKYAEVFSTTSFSIEILYTPLVFDTDTTLFPVERYNYILNSNELFIRYNLDDSGDGLLIANTNANLGDPDQSISLTVNHSINKSYLLTLINSYDGVNSNIKVYINGNLEFDDINNFIVPTGLAQYNNIGETFNSKFHNIKVYYAAISDRDVKTNYNFYKDRFNLQ